MPDAAVIYGPDGLPVRPVSRWNARKHHFLRRYVAIFSQGMSKAWDRRTYLDLLAGPGMCFNKTTQEYEEGSPFIAMARPFTSFVFVEMEPMLAAALRSRVAKHPKADNAVILEGNCNTLAPTVRTYLPEREEGLTFAFVDPTSWQVSFDTIATLADGRRLDLLVTLTVGFMKRVADRDVPMLDAAFGTEDWRGPYGRNPPTSHLLEVYRAQLAKLDYMVDASIPVIPVRNSKNALMYYLTFFSKHPLGYEYWKKIATVDEMGQMLLSEAAGTWEEED